MSPRAVIARWSALLALTAAGPLFAQGPGRIIGRVVDAEQGAPVAGAQVELVDAPIRAVSALDGRYTLPDVPAGTVSIRVRMIGFAPKMVTGVVVTEGKAAVQDVAMVAEAVQLAEISVSAASERGTVNRALEEQRHAVNIVNAVSAEQIARSPDSDAGQAIQRVSGVTVQDGKYIFVRGLGERYTTTTLNGSRIPSPEPERKVVPLDLFPSSLLEGITTSKTFTADQPGDFSGAEVDLKTREFPAHRVITFSVSGGLNTAATGRNVVKAPTVGPEWLGFAGGERTLPGNLAAAGDLHGITLEQQNALIGSLRNVWSARSADGAPNGGASVAIGGETPIFSQDIGYIGSLSYNNSQEVQKDLTRGLAKNGAQPGTALPYNTYTGSAGRNSVLWGGLLNLSTHVGTGSKLSLNNTYTRTADNEASVLDGNNEEFSQYNPLVLTRLTFTERAVRSNQIQGEHLFGERHFVDWSVTNSSVDRNEPDRSDLGYTGRLDPTTGELVPTTWTGAARFATRTFSDLHEHSWDLGGNYRLQLGSPESPAAIKVGAAYRSTDRDADTRAYDIINNALDDAARTAPPETIFTEANIAAGNFILNANANGGRYTAAERITAGYAQLELPVSRRLEVIAGARVERWRLDVDTRTTQGQIAPARPRNTDVLPALALTYHLTDDQNLRLSATQTLSRPEYRELSPVPYFEQVGLATTIGNPELRRALIQNYDLRWEWFPRTGEVLSLGVFAKRFSDPIEKVITQAAGTNTLQFVNADKAHNYGMELELRKGLDFLSEGLRPFNLFANTTLMRSRITPGNNGISALTNADRPMVGQSEYVVNAGLGYGSESGDWSATLLYNVAGRRILEAGSGGLPDAYEEPRHLIDASLQIPVAQAFTLKLDGKNLLNAPYRLVQGDVLRTRYLSGRVFGLTMSWRR
ncbi:MAG TPA: TonB-dependent receptor [Gemmatimonadales bacterium]|nr:TonB-dependent receptor [Gemmatimonadales bacterium]